MTGGLLRGQQNAQFLLRRPQPPLSCFDRSSSCSRSLSPSLIFDFTSSRHGRIGTCLCALCIVVRVPRTPVPQRKKGKGQVKYSIISSITVWLINDLERTRRGQPQPPLFVFVQNRKCYLSSAGQCNGSAPHAIGNYPPIKQEVKGALILMMMMLMIHRWLANRYTAKFLRTKTKCSGCAAQGRNRSNAIRLFVSSTTF